MNERRTLAGLAVALGVLAIPLAVFAIVVLFTPWSSWSARTYATGVIVATWGLLTARRDRPRGATRLGLAVLALTVLLRMATAAGGATVSMTTTHSSPDGKDSARLLGRLIDEGDAAIWGAYLAFGAGMFRDPDVPHVPAALRDAYGEMRGREGDGPSPVLPTYCGMEGAGHSDVLVVDDVREPRGALIFLHGFGGSFALPCWQLAQTAAESGLVTYCPSIGPKGDWWSGDGERVVRETLELARARGISRFVLAGLSNGGVGASRIAARMRGSFRGVVLVAGADPDAGPTGVPVLLLQGRRDAMMPASRARAYASGHASTTYVDLDAGHFALLVRRVEAMRALHVWLEAQ